MFERLLSYVGSIASLISLGLTIYVIIDLSRIKNKYIFRIGAPNFLKELEKTRNTLQGCTINFEESRAVIRKALITIDVKLRVFEKRVSAESRESIKRLRREIANYNGDKNQIYEICDCIVRVYEEVKQHREEISLG